MSREIFLVNDYDGVFKGRFESNIESWGPATSPQIHQNPSVTNVTSPFGKGRLTISLRRFHQFPFANLRRLRRHLLPKEGG